MQDLRRLVAKAMDTENLQGVLVEQDLQHTDRVAGDLGASGVFKERFAHFIGHFGFSQLTLVGAKRANFRDGVDTSRDIADKAVLFFQQLVTGV